MEDRRPFGGDTEVKYTATVEGTPVDIDFEVKSDGTIEAQVAGRAYRIQADVVRPGIYWFNWQNQSIEIALTTSPDGYDASVGERHLSIVILDARAALRKASQHAHDGIIELKAPMPGKIVRVLALEGAEVKANQGVLVMEAMKM